MDVLTFLSKIIQSLAWPITTIILASLLRRPVIGLIPLLRKLKYKEFELEFSQQVSELKAEAESLSGKADSEEKVTSPNSERILNLVSYSAPAAIMEAWLEVESAAVEVASSFWNKPANDVFRNYHKLGEYLMQCNVINRKQLDMFNKLRSLRNKAAHAKEMELSEDDVRIYVKLALDLAEYIKKRN